MRIIFLGTPAFAVPALQRLLDHGYEVGAVFTQPDRPAGRGHKLQPSPVKVVASRAGIPVHQPEKVRAEENRQTFDALKPDFIVVAAYGQILPKWLLESARLGSINIHASLLPRYRGAAPIAWAILNGDAESGVTTMLMAEKLDAGAILMQEKVEIPLTMTAGELSDVLSEAGADLLIETMQRMEAGTLEPAEQDESKVTWAPKITKEIARITWNRNALELHNQIRGMNPWPGAYTEFRGEKLHLWRSLPHQKSSSIAAAEPGTFLGPSDKGILVQCGGGTVIDLLELQRPAKGRVTGREFASGARLQSGDLVFS